MLKISITIRKYRGGGNFFPPPRQPVSKPDVRLNRVKCLKDAVVK